LPVHNWVEASYDELLFHQFRSPASFPILPNEEAYQKRAEKYLHIAGFEQDSGVFTFATCLSSI